MGTSGCLAFLDEDSFIYAGGHDGDLEATAYNTAYMVNLTGGSLVR